jgi:hypothetical protein
MGKEHDGVAALLLQAKTAPRPSSLFFLALLDLYSGQTHETQREKEVGDKGKGF